MPEQLITFGSRVTACDCLMVGRVNMVWRVSPAPYFRVQFPPRSPFIGDWAVYRTGEIALFVERPKLTNVNVVNIMRPKFPRFQT
jgi:hypothetical protein